MIHRRSLLCALPAVGCWVGLAKAQAPARPDPLDSKLVNRFVGRSHGDLEAVREMIKEQPRLVFASWDWGGGDWETGLGAASHVGRRDIAEYLLEQGARIDAFATAMLGMTPLMEAMLKASPKIHTVPGSHGIPLLSHAVVGGDKALPILRMLIARKADPNAAANQGATPLMLAASGKRIEAIELLLEAGADPSKQDGKGDDAAAWARRRGHNQLADRLAKLAKS